MSIHLLDFPVKKTKKERKQKRIFFKRAGGSKDLCCMNKTIGR